MPLQDVDAVLLLSFGGPEGHDDVQPFLENVTRGRGIPPERLAEVGRHYHEVFDGVSPINEQCRRLQAALEEVLDLPVYWGNRNWHPFLADTARRMTSDGIRHALVVTTSAFPSYSGCRQYREDLAGVEGGPRFTKLRNYWSEPGFLDVVRDNALATDLADPFLLFTAHSVPLQMAHDAGPTGGAYVDSLRNACARVAGERAWDLAWQSRSGRPGSPWLEPDVSERLASLHDEGVREVVVVPIGFTSDHVEVVYDLDVVAIPGAPEAMQVRRAATVGTDPRFVRMLRDLVIERIEQLERDDHGGVGTQDTCPERCCLPKGDARPDRPVPA